ncbi:MAG: hypothetical protein ACJAS9_001382 [Polaribacter sp.]
MNISASDNYNINQTRLSITNNSVIKNGVSNREDNQFSTQNINSIRNSSSSILREQSANIKADREQETKVRSKSNIEPNLLEKVFKLRSNEEQSQLSNNRSSDLYLQTEVIESAIANELGISLDLYV